MVESSESKKGARVRLWLGELPGTITGESLCLNTQADVRGNCIWTDRKIALELCLPKNNSNYGLLGLEFKSSDSKGNLEIKVHYSDQNDKIFQDTLAYNKDTVFSALPEEYAEIVLKKSLEFIHDNPALPVGVLSFTAGAHCEVGSSRFLFAIITNILLKIMVINRDNFNIREIEEIIDRELIFR